jgi:hypothetical protein
MITIGTDVEFFFVNSDNKIVTSQEVIKGKYGSKNRPYMLPHGAVHRDNVAGEFAMKPARTADEFVDNISAVLLDIKKEIFDKFDVRPLFTPSIHIDIDKLNHHEHRRFGCAGDYNAYLGEKNDSPTALDAGSLRTAAGHMHAGFDHENMSDQCLAAISADIFMGLPSVEHDKDGIERKQKLYGKAGAFRPKPYGIEYRTPSNFWMKSEKMMRWAFNHMRAAILLRHQVPELLGDGSVCEFIRTAINSGDVGAAHALMDLWNIEERVEAVS